jgi:amino acid adenylation domain-containing protein
MPTSFSDVLGFPPEQEALRARCFHPIEPFIEYSRDEIEQSIADRFENQVRKHPRRLAIKTRDRELTYDELNRAANRVAHAILAARGERQEQAALLCDPGAMAIVGTLAVLKAGKTYVPLDPAVPKARNEFILRDAQIGLIVTDDEHFLRACELAPKGVAMINIDALESHVSSDNPGLHIPPDRLSYLMYTSGSTGEPKGVVQNHRNVLAKVMGWVNVVHISPGDRLSLLRALNVSGSIRDLFGGLLCGAAVLPFDLKREGLAHFAGWLSDEKITIYNSVVTLFRSLGGTLRGSENFSSIRLIRLSGEPVYKRDVEIFRKHFSRDTLLINMLASAEVGSTRVYFIDKDTLIHENLVPIGYPMEGCEVLLLDGDGKALGTNQVGEIAVRSRYLSPGYWRRPDLTEAAFLPDPKGGDRRIFRTGDLGCMLPDGCLVHHGRKDSHVKIRGYSVELAEIEAALIEFDGVKEAVVTTKENAHGNQILVAYVVPTGASVVAVSALRKGLAAKLPDYMIPSAFVLLDCFPLVGPGKVDYRALPVPSRARPDLATALAFARTPVEEKLVKIWTHFLDVDQVGIHDRFLELGGDSLLASRIICHVIDVFRVEVPLRTLFETPTVADMAAAIQGILATTQSKPEVMERALAEVEGLSEGEAKELLSKREHNSHGSD